MVPASLQAPIFDWAIMNFKNINTRLSGSAHVQRVVSRSKEVYLPGFDGFSIFEVWLAFTRQLTKTSLMERAAAISFNAVMAIPPTLIFLFTLIPHLPISSQFTQELYGVIRDFVPGKENHTTIIQFLEDFINRPRNELLSFGLFLALFFSSNAMMGVLRSFDKDYEGFEKRTGIHQRKSALLLTIVCFVLVFIFLFLLIAQGAVLRWIGIENFIVRVIIVNVRWVIIVLLIFFIISFIYRNGPSITKRWPLLTPGSVFATTLMLLATFLVSYYVNNFNNYNKVYGSISAIFILMTLIFVNSLVILVGFELNVATSNLRRQKALEAVVGAASSQEV
jgi:membrane protein